MSSKTAPAEANGNRTGLIVVLVSSLLLGIGFLVAIYVNFIADSETKAKPQYIAFVNIPVTSGTGRMEISFHLSVDQTDAPAVNQAKNGVEAHLRASLATLDPNAFYSRDNKVWLAEHIKSLANRELGEKLVEGVYFGDFKIFGSKPVAPTSHASEQN
jgi:flagellar basal body-associated protein FliL